MVDFSSLCPNFRVPRTFKTLAINDDEDSRWTNRDVLPVPEDQIRYNWKAYFGYWCAVGFNVTTWSLGSSNLANGLDAAGTMGGIFVGTVLAFFVAFVSGEAGVRYNLGFPMMSRATFGMYGSYFVIALKCFVNIVFFGYQAYWGGLAMNVMLGSIFTSFKHLPNTLPLSSAITTQELIGFVIYIVIFTSMMFIHPSRLQPFIYISQIGVNITMVGLFIWAMSANHGATFLPPSKTVDKSTRVFLIFKAMSSVAGSWTGASLRQSDWTRFTRDRRAVVINQGVTGIVTATVCALLGISTASAVKNMYGTAIWNPITLLSWLQTNNYDSATRAGTFFAGFGFFLSQITINLVQNSVACGMDLASLAPRWIDVTRGSLIMCVVGYLIQPWRFINAPGLFISVLVSFGMFVSPLAAINFVDFWLIRKLKWKIPDLYRGDKTSIYWYTYGLNWRAFVTWAVVVWPCMPGFVAAMGGATVAIGWSRVFDLSWIVGFVGGSLIYWIICKISPPPGAPYVVEYLDSHPEYVEQAESEPSGVEIIKGVSPQVTDLEGSGSPKTEKN